MEVVSGTNHLWPRLGLIIGQLQLPKINPRQQLPNSGQPKYSQHSPWPPRCGLLPWVLKCCVNPSIWASSALQVQHHPGDINVQKRNFEKCHFHKLSNYIFKNLHSKFWQRLELFDIAGRWFDYQIRGQWHLQKYMS